jgi:hypothetical protein
MKMRSGEMRLRVCLELSGLSITRRALFESALPFDPNKQAVTARLIVAPAPKAVATKRRAPERAHTNPRE